MEKMSRLLKAYGFNSDMQYFEMIIESVINGNRTQAKEQFNAMPKDDKKRKALMKTWPRLSDIEKKKLQEKKFKKEKIFN